ncbi:MAG: amidohydrolase family protein [Gemmatimonadaceae bacterium]
MSVRTRYHARWVVPVSHPAIADGTVVTEDDRIVWVGPRADAPRGGTDDDLGDAILAPGLVNAHTHLDLTMLRGALEDLAFADWVGTLVRIKREMLSAPDLTDAALLGVAEGLSAGITTFADTADNDAPFRAMRALGVRGIAYREVFGPDPAQRDASLAALDVAVRAMRAHATPLVRVGVSPHAPYSVSDPLFAAVAAYASEHDLPVAVHIAESDAEDQLVKNGSGPFAERLRARGIAVGARGATALTLLDRAGLLRAGTLLIHCVRVSTAQTVQIAQAGCGVAHCPVSNAKLGHGVAPLLDLFAAHVRVGLGSDSMASNNTMDLLAEARLASLQQRARSQRADVLPAAAALRLATLGSAEALRLEHVIGSLEVGKQADLAAFEVPAVGQPVVDPEAALVFAHTALRARRVVVAGSLRVRDGVVLGLDPTTAGRVADTARRVSEWRRAHHAG